MSVKQTSGNTSNRFVISIKFAALSIFCVWTYDEFPWSIRFNPESNTYILGEYDEYLFKRISEWFLTI